MGSHPQTHTQSKQTNNPNNQNGDHQERRQLRRRVRPGRRCPSFEGGQQAKWRPSRTPPTTSPSPSRAEVPKLRRRPTSKLLRTVMPASEPVPLLPRMPSQTRLINPPTRARLISTRRLLSTKLLATNKQTYLTTVR